MNKYLKPAVAAGFFCILCGCAGPTGTEDLFRDKPAFDLPAAGKLPLAMRDVYGILLFDDYVVIEHYRNPYLLGIYDIHTGDTVKMAARYGVGPDEYTFVTDVVKVNDSTFATMSANSNQYISFYRLGDLSPGKPFHPFRRVNLRRSPKTSPGIMDGHPDIRIRAGNDTLIVGQALDWKGEKMLGSLHPDDKELQLFIDYPEDDQQEQLGAGPKSSLYQGPISLNDTGDRMFRAVSSADIVEFFRIDAAGAILPVKQYRFSTPPFVRIDPVNVAHDSRTSVDYFQDIAWNDGKVYLLTSTMAPSYQRREILGRAYRALCETGKEEIYARIFVYTQDGDPLYTLRLDVNPIYILFHRGKLYALSGNADGDYELRYYDVNALK